MNILAKALTVFPNPDFSLCLHLLPPHILHASSTASSLPAAGEAPLSEAVQKLNVLSSHLSDASYKAFWATLESDDLYADLIADISGFEELIRVRIAVTVGQSCREVERGTLEQWLQLRGQDFEKFISDICGWGLSPNREGRGGMVIIPVNKENEAKGSVSRELGQFDRALTPMPRLGLTRKLICYRVCQGHKASIRAACLTFVHGVSWSRNTQIANKSAGGTCFFNFDSGKEILATRYLRRLTQRTWQPITPLHLR